jgi:photosystem II stability/assembly factor-like uncharacterized protein
MSAIRKAWWWEVPVITAALLAPTVLAGQQATGSVPGKATVASASIAGDPKLKGIWEPVSYPADLVLNDVFFVTPDIGWVTGGKYGGRDGGVLLYTRDGGASWDTQLGDAESAEPPFTNLHFLDERHGWAVQSAGIGNYKLLRTTDAESWDQIGSIEAAWGLLDYAFTSPTNGIFLDGNDNVARLMHTSDGGRTWTEVYRCPALQLQIEGLTKEITCTFKALHFPSANVGYAVGGAHEAKRTLFVGKTEDGGKTWKTSTVFDIGADLEVYFEQEVYFTDELTGFVHLSDKKLYRTTDGGRTWKGLVATPGPELRFADSQVGWSFFSYKSLSYTTDGGKRWTSREFAFPAKVNAFSLPRRDRAYVVGEHGMIYRYRVVPAGDAATVKALAAPAMPIFDSPLDDRVGELDQVVDALESAVAAAPDSGPGSGAAEPSPDTPEGAESVEDTESVEHPESVEGEVPAESTAVAEEGDLEASAFTARCCVKPLAKFDLLLTAVTGLVPQFLGQYKNTNLLLAGLRMLSDLPGRVNDLNQALRSFRKAPDKAAAAAALNRVSAAIAALNQSTDVAFQRKLPENGIAGEAAAAAPEGVAAEPDAGQEHDSEERLDEAMEGAAESEPDSLSE